MPTDNFDTLVQIQFEDSPKELRELLTGDEFLNLILGIGQAHELNENAQNEILNETTLILLGLSAVEDLATYILPLVNNEKEKADGIATEIFDMVLYENLGLVPTSLSPRAEEIFAALNNEETNSPATEPENTVPTAAPSTIPNPIPPPAPETNATEITPEAGIPRYAKPLTDLPRYNDNQQ